MPCSISPPASKSDCSFQGRFSGTMWEWLFIRRESDCGPGEAGASLFF